MFKLVIQDDEGKTTVVPLIRDEITIGRKEGNTIRLTERNVSRRHARIVRNNGEVQIEDLGSYNGIRVNNARIAERVSLRISDQVQIGDYKLYLKAEGVEQVDDARTMPIERVDANTATDVIAIPAAPAAAAPMSATAAATPAPQIVGNPARTLVAIADTDPAGRPLATAATVAALAAPVGYGKLVVLSSNFAGKEFELSRPQMIVGRTDENDICINHRSISRNHAKLVREPDTGRYTISDLQSSNGVRVNGQDYGKVELRRGDVVDLGHVRLRFVEPGEDFVFTRDAVITDVPDGGKKGMLVVVLGVLVLGAVITFFVLRGGDNKPAGGGTGSQGLAGALDAGPLVATNPNPGSDGSAAENPGSGQTLTPDALVAEPNPNPGTASEQMLKCLELQGNRKWNELQMCANQLVGTEKDKAKAFIQKATEETAAESAAAKVVAAVNEEGLKKAQDQLGKISPSSVYYGEAKKKYDVLERKIIDSMVAKGRELAGQKKCKDLDKLGDQAPTKQVESKIRAIPCTEKVATGSGSGNPQVVITPPPPACTAQQAADLKQKGNDDANIGNDAAALLAFEKSMACKADSGLYRNMVLAACKSNNPAKAKQYFTKLSPANQAPLEARCTQLHVQVR